MVLYLMVGRLKVLVGHFTKCMVSFIESAQVVPLILFKKFLMGRVVSKQNLLSYFTPFRKKNPNESYFF